MTFSVSFFSSFFQVEFADGFSVATISLTIRDDDIAEFAEVTYVRLVRIVDDGSTLPSRGAQLGLPFHFKLFLFRTSKICILDKFSRLILFFPLFFSLLVCFHVLSFSPGTEKSQRELFFLFCFRGDDPSNGDSAS